MIDRTEHLAAEAAISESLRTSVRRLFDAARQTVVNDPTKPAEPAVEVTIQRKDLEVLLMAFASRTGKR
jgi:hypothetical protein